jgi:hypothetical protein
MYETFGLYAVSIGNGRLSHSKALVSMTFVRHSRALSVHHLSLKWLLRHFRSCRYRSGHSW